MRAAFSAATDGVVEHILSDNRGCLILGSARDYLKADDILEDWLVGQTHRGSGGGSARGAGTGCRPIAPALRLLNVRGLPELGQAAREFKRLSRFVERPPPSFPLLPSWLVSDLAGI